MQRNTIPITPWFLYMIECQDGSIYTGITVNVTARYAVHKNGTGARYMRSHPPKRLLTIVDYPDRSAASKAEYAIKQLSSADKWRYAGNCLTNTQSLVKALEV